MVFNRVGKLSRDLLIEDRYFEFKSIDYEPMSISFGRSPGFIAGSPHFSSINARLDLPKWRVSNPKVGSTFLKEEKEWLFFITSITEWSLVNDQWTLVRYNVTLDNAWINHISKTLR